jgi:hypothetical protein
MMAEWAGRTIAQTAEDWLAHLDQATPDPVAATMRALKPGSYASVRGELGLIRYGRADGGGSATELLVEEVVPAGPTR